MVKLQNYGQFYRGFYNSENYTGDYSKEPWSDHSLTIVPWYQNAMLFWDIEGIIQPKSFMFLAKNEL